MLYDIHVDLEHMMLSELQHRLVLEPLYRIYPISSQ